MINTQKEILHIQRKFFPFKGKFFTYQIDKFNWIDGIFFMISKFDHKASLNS